MKLVGVDVSQQVSWAGLLDKLISTKVEHHLVQPTFLVDYPVAMSPLSKKKKDDPRVVERFEGFANVERWVRTVAGRPAPVRAYENGASINTVPTITEESKALLFGMAGDKAA